MAEDLAGIDGDAVDPRLHGCDESSRESIDEPHLRDHVEWELEGLERSRLVAMYFDPAFTAPRALLQLGIVAARAPEKLIVCCPHGFWCKGDVEIVCRRFGVTIVKDWFTFVYVVRDSV